MEANLDVRLELAQIMEWTEYEDNLKDCDEIVDLFWKLYTENVKRFDFSPGELRKIYRSTNKALGVVFETVLKHISNNEQPKDVEHNKFIYEQPSQEQIDQWEGERKERNKNKKKGGGKFLSWSLGGKLSIITLCIFKQRIQLLIG